jgi:hypothetical protein
MNQRTFRAIPRDQRHSVLAPFESRHFGVEPKIGLVLFRSVTRIAVSFEDRLDIPVEIY